MSEHPRMRSIEEDTVSKKLRTAAKELPGLSADERQRLEDIAGEVSQLEKSTQSDKRTGLLNREGFEKAAQRMMAFSARERKDKNKEFPTALLAIDLDGFKEVNDTGGHACGNRCLELIAEQVKAVLRESDIFGRVGGDEFNIFLAKCTQDNAFGVAKKVRAAIEGPVRELLQKEFPAYTGRLSASIGIVAADEEDATLEEMMTRADYAAYVVKAAGKRDALTYPDAQEVDADGAILEAFKAGKPVAR